MIYIVAPGLYSSSFQVADIKSVSFSLSYYVNLLMLAFEHIIYFGWFLPIIILGRFWSRNTCLNLTAEILLNYVLLCYSLVFQWSWNCLLPLHFTFTQMGGPFNLTHWVRWPFHRLWFVHNIGVFHIFGCLTCSVIFLLSFLIFSYGLSYFYFIQ